eukprot:gene42261-56139_t
MAEGWKTMDVGVCLDDLINAKSIPNVVGLPMVTALGGMGFADKLLDPTYYETVESMLTKLYKKYGSEYEQERKTISLPLVKALDKSFKAQISGRTVSSLIRSEDPLKHGYLPETVAEYVDAAARHAVNKTKLDQSKRLRKHGFSSCTFTESEWYNSNEAVAFVDSKSGKAYKQAKGKSWIQDKDKKSKQSADVKKRPQRDYESNHRGDSSRRRVSSQSRDSAHDETSVWDRKGPRDNRLEYPNSDSRRQRERGVSFDRDRSRSPSQSKQPLGITVYSASKDKGKGGSSFSRPSETSKDKRGTSSRDDRRGSSSRED